MMVRVIGVCLGLLISAARPAAADPIPVSAGSEVRIDYEGDWFVLRGPDFDARTGFLTWGFEIPRDNRTCVICAPGDQLDLGFSTPGEVPLWTGTATVGGTTYSDVAFRGGFAFETTPMAFPDITSDYYFPRMPFRFTGFLRGFVDDEEVFATSLVGSGMAGMTYFRREDGRYQDEYGNRSYLFTEYESAAPTPEPATLVLLGSGLAGVLARARGKRIASQTDPLP